MLILINTVECKLYPELCPLSTIVVKFANIKLLTWLKRL